jgi:lipid-binding SYLF domain-containing protein
MIKTVVSGRAGPSRRVVLAGAVLAGASLTGLDAQAATAAELDASASAALKKLYAQSRRARELGRKARAILIFPKITKAGFVIGGEGGDGVLRVGSRTSGYYRIVAASFGFQAGAQQFGYVLFLISQSAVDYLHRSQGWSIGAGPTVAIIDEGVAKQPDTTTLTQDVYAMPFNHKGLMAGLNLEGSKITQIHPR